VQPDASKTAPVFYFGFLCFDEEGKNRIIMHSISGQIDDEGLKQSASHRSGYQT